MENQIHLKEICPTTTQKWIEKGAWLIDVRSPEEVAQLAFDVPHIMNIPLFDFEKRFKEINPKVPVIMVCKNGAKSILTANYLLKHGYTEVMCLQKGLIQWVQKGFPVHGDVNPYLGSENENCCSSTHGC